MGNVGKKDVHEKIESITQYIALPITLVSII